MEVSLSKSFRNPHALYCDDPSLTKQSFKDECDINLIIERARNGADITHLNTRVASYGDFSNVPDYQSALDMVNRANSMFMELDARVRSRFNNDPGRLLQFMQDPANFDEAVKIGLLLPKPVESGVSGPDKALSEAPGGASQSSKSENSGAKSAESKV